MDGRRRCREEQHRTGGRPVRPPRKVAAARGGWETAPVTEAGRRNSGCRRRRWILASEATCAGTAVSEDAARAAAIRAGEGRAFRSRRVLPRCRRAGPNAAAGMWGVASGGSSDCLLGAFTVRLVEGREAEVVVAEGCRRLGESKTSLSFTMERIGDDDLGHDPFQGFDFSCEEKER